ncbi:ABC transporter permease [Paenibacillus alkalitolerans]|uniref:ABC transporter permease n=1 Tax=Paenibacillus alkalitolerans TaxID=2799335 RepID=UPI0018F43332|nr:ABC transporter permease [Paenibacillus alkalitolerans]
MKLNRRIPIVNLLIWPSIIFILVFLMFPLAKVILNSFLDPEFTLKHYLRFFQEPAYLQVLWNTIRIGLQVTLITLLLGYPVAYMIASVPNKWQNLLLICVLLPFWTSFLVRTYAWIVILQKEGVVNKTLMYLGLIHEPLKLVHNTTGVLVGLSHVLLPFMILPLYSIMKNIDMDLVKAAQSLGAPPVQAFARVFFPLSIPGIAAGSILVFIISIGYYVTPALLGGSKDTMISQLIAQQIGEQLNWGFGSAIALVLLLVVLILLYLFNRFVGIDKISFGS